MKRQRFKKFVVVMTAFACILAIGCLVSAETFNQTIIFAANTKGFASEGKTVNMSNSTGFKSKLTGFKFTGMASGTMPNSNTEINFRLYKNDNHTVKATVATAHTYSNYVNGTWKSGVFFDGINHSSTDVFVIASNATNASGLGATVGVRWKYYQ